VAPLPVSAVEEPLQIVTLEPPLTVGKALTETWTVAVLVQPLTSVPVTVYVVVLEGFAVTLVPVVADRLAPGAHV